MNELDWSLFYRYESFTHTQSHCIIFIGETCAFIFSVTIVINNGLMTFIPKLLNIDVNDAEKKPNAPNFRVEKCVYNFICTPLHNLQTFDFHSLIDQTNS